MRTRSRLSNENASATARIGVKLAGKWHCGVSELTIVKTSSLTPANHCCELRAQLTGTGYGQL